MKKKYVHLKLNVHRNSTSLPCQFDVQIKPFTPLVMFEVLLHVHVHNFRITPSPAILHKLYGELTRKPIGSFSSPARNPLTKNKNKY